MIDIFKEKTEMENTEIEVGKELLLLTLTGKDVKPTFLERFHKILIKLNGQKIAVIYF